MVRAPLKPEKPDSEIIVQVLLPHKARLREMRVPGSQ